MMFRLSFILILISGSVFGQSKKLWMLSAENAYKAKDWATASYYYAKVLDDTTVLETFVLPYEAQMVNLKIKALVKVPELQLRKPKKDSTQQVQKTDTKTSKTDTIRKRQQRPPENFTPMTGLDYVYMKLGHSYRLNADYDNALRIYKICVERKSWPDARYYYALALMAKKKYQDALDQFDMYVTTSPENDSLKILAQKKESSCFFALDTLNNTKRKVQVKMFDTLVFNRGTANFAPQYFLGPNKIIFTSARRGGVVNDPEKQDPKYLCDLYYTEYIDSIWQRPINFGRPVNTALHEGAGQITPFEQMIFTRWSDANRDESIIYIANMNNGKFFEAFKLGENVNVAGHKSMHPYVNFDGTRLFYSSNRPGGFGGMDIWVCVLDENGVFGRPINLGSQINTAADEVCPFYHSVSNTLYFSSNGLPGLGGLDIFKASFNVDDSIYAFPKNVGAPVNSSKDDAYFIMERTQQRGFFSSDREECEGGHCYDIYEFINAPIFFDIRGVVFDANTNDPIPNALVTLIDVHGEDEPIYVATDDKGEYFSTLKADREYFMKAQKSKYLADKASQATKGLTETKHLEQDFFLSIIPAGEVEIEGIEYDFDKATLRPKSKENLDKIVDLLNLNDNLSVAINAHTDSRGNDAYNERLSQARAQSCVDYLISKGIKKDRLMAKGWGEKQPVIKEAEINKMVAKSPEWEAAHQKNRRTAFKVIGESSLKIINKTK
jgi:outer membrane protein OmpA-like peptidoglycan-associated protein/tetratricopeptide (TPR) repeat protein